MMDFRPHAAKRYAIIFLFLFGFCFSRISAAQLESVPRQSMVIDGLERTFKIFDPGNLGDVPAPVVFALHGGAGDADLVSDLFFEGRWNELAELNRFLVVYPEGRDDPDGNGGHHWNDCRPDHDIVDPEVLSTEDDMAFLSALMDWVEGQYLIDPARIYVTGLSNGGLMTLRAAAEIGERLAAVAVVAAAPLASSECGAPAIPMPILFMHGTADNYIRVNGGCIGDEDQCYLGETMPIQDGLNFWIALNGTDVNPTLIQIPDYVPEDNSTVDVFTYGNGVGNTEVVYYRINDGGHNAPGAEPLDAETEGRLGVKNRDITAAREIWSFFAKHTRTTDEFNVPPVAASDGPFAIPADVGADLDVLGNDSDSNGDILTVAAVMQPLHGTVSIGDFRASVVYVPDAGYLGADQFSYYVSDGNGGIGIATVYIHVSENTAPAAQAQHFTTGENIPVNILLTASDLDGDTPMFAVKSPPANGWLSGTVPALTYTPFPGFSGTDSFDFVSYDYLGAKSSATIIINVKVNLAPIVEDLTYTVTYGNPVDITLSAMDPENDPVSFAVSTLPQNGQLAGRAPNLQYYHNLGFTGEDSFEYVVYDTMGKISTGTVTVIVEPAPIFAYVYLLDYGRYLVNVVVWAGTSDDQVEIYRDGLLLKVAPNTGQFIDIIDTLVEEPPSTYRVSPTSDTTLSSGEVAPILYQ